MQTPFVSIKRCLKKKLDIFSRQSYCRLDKIQLSCQEQHTTCWRSSQIGTMSLLAHLQSENNTKGKTSCVFRGDKIPNLIWFLLATYPQKSQSISLIHSLSFNLARRNQREQTLLAKRVVNENFPICLIFVIIFSSAYPSAFNE